jgi:hypothetical protein
MTFANLHTLEKEEEEAIWQDLGLDGQTDLETSASRNRIILVSEDYTSVMVY